MAPIRGPIRPLIAPFATGPGRVTGFGVLQAGDAGVAGVGTIGVDGIGALMATSALISGSGTIGIMGTGSLQVQEALLAAAGVVSVTGTGALQAEAAQIVGIGGSGNIAAVAYTGGAGFLVYEAATHGTSNGTIIRGWISGKFRSGGTTQVLFDCGGAVPVQLRLESDNTLNFSGGTAGAVFENATTNIPIDEYGTIFFVANGTSSQLYWLSASGLVTGSNSAGTPADLTLANDWHIGETVAGGSRIHFNMSGFALYTTDLDYSNSANREEHWDTTANKMRNPGADGSNVPGTPVIFNVSPAASHGSEADTAGLFADDTSPGSYADDYSFVSLEFAELENFSRDTTSVGDYTLSGADLGTADDNRVIYIAVNVFQNTGVQPITCTVDGGSATSILQSITGNSNSALFAIHQDDFVTTGPTATAGDIVIDSPGGGNFRGARITTYRGVGYSATATDTLASTINIDPSTGSLNYADNGLVIAAAAVNSTLTRTWNTGTSGLVEDYSGSMFFDNVSASQASVTGTSPGETTVECDYSGTPTASTMIAASFAPV